MSQRGGAREERQLSEKSVPIYPTKHRCYEGHGRTIATKRRRCTFDVLQCRRGVLPHCAARLFLGGLEEDGLFSKVQERVRGENVQVCREEFQLSRNTEEYTRQHISRALPPSDDRSGPACPSHRHSSARIPYFATSPLYLSFTASVFGGAFVAGTRRQRNSHPIESARARASPTAFSGAAAVMDALRPARRRTYANALECERERASQREGADSLLQAHLRRIDCPSSACLLSLLPSIPSR